MRVLDLFSGIGGFALAGQWVWGNDHEIVGFCEIDKYCHKVLNKNFPGVPIYEDIQKLNGKDFNDIDLITGGFPCTDISVAGRGKGLIDEETGEKTRSGLWFEMLRIISEVRPRFALIENVPMLTIRGGTRVIADLTKIGYDAEWTIIGADDVGAWHKRKRIWIVAYEKECPNTNSDGCDYGKRSAKKDSKRITGKGRMERNQFTKLCRDVSDTDGTRRARWANDETDSCSRDINRKSSKILSTKRKGYTEVPNTGSIGRIQEQFHPSTEWEEKRSLTGKHNGTNSTGRNTKESKGYWTVEPELGRVANGIPNRVDRLKGLGNAIVPQVAELIMNKIKKVYE